MHMLWLITLSWTPTKIIFDEKDWIGWFQAILLSIKRIYEFMGIMMVMMIIMMIMVIIVIIMITVIIMIIVITMVVMIIVIKLIVVIMVIVMIMMIESKTRSWFFSK